MLAQLHSSSNSNRETQLHIGHQMRVQVRNERTYVTKEDAYYSLIQEGGF